EIIPSCLMFNIVCSTGFTRPEPILLRKCSGEEIYRIKIGSAFLCYFLLQRQKKVETMICTSKESEPDCSCQRRVRLKAKEVRKIGLRLTHKLLNYGMVHLLWLVTFFSGDSSLYLR